MDLLEKMKAVLIPTPTEEFSLDEVPVDDGYDATLDEGDKRPANLPPEADKNG